MSAKARPWIREGLARLVDPVRRLARGRRCLVCCASLRDLGDHRVLVATSEFRFMACGDLYLATARAGAMSMARKGGYYAHSADLCAAWFPKLRRALGAV